MQLTKQGPAHASSKNTNANTKANAKEVEIQRRLKHWQASFKTSIWIDLGWTFSDLVSFAIVWNRVLCSVNVLGWGVVAQKRMVITMTVADTIDSVITIGAVVTSIGIVIAMVRRRRMTTRVVSFPWSIPSVSSEAFSFVPNWKYLWGFYDKCDHFHDMTILLTLGTLKGDRFYGSGDLNRKNKLHD